MEGLVDEGFELRGGTGGALRSLHSSLTYIRKEHLANSLRTQVTTFCARWNLSVQVSTLEGNNKKEGAENARGKQYFIAKYMSVLNTH